MYKHTPPPRLTGICSHVLTGTQTSTDHAGIAMPTSEQGYIRNLTIFLTPVSRDPFPGDCGGFSHPEIRNTGLQRNGRLSKS